MIHAAWWTDISTPAALPKKFIVKKYYGLQTADKGKSADNFVVTGGETLVVGLTPRKLPETALAENDRRMSQYDHDQYLVRPWLMLLLAGLTLKLVK